jgi:Ca2+/Na+ antiporter
MVVLIVLNIILIILLAFFVLYIFKSKNKVNKIDCNDEKQCTIDENKINENKQKNINSEERVFFGRFITDEEYEQMIKNRRSDISILLEDVKNEYKHLKELNK